MIGMSKNSPVRTIHSRKANPVLLCKKCLSRIDDGRELRRELKSELKRQSGERGAKRPRVVLTGCFGICPKRAVVVANGETLHRGEFLLLSDSGTAADAATMLMPKETS